MKNFLLELGVEEIPAGYIAGTIQKIDKFFKDLFKKNKIHYDGIKTFSTPRRFAILITNLLEAQKDETIEVTGPGKKIAIDDDGNFTKAGLGFLKKAGVNPEDTYLKTTKKGEYLAFKKFIKGKQTKDIIINAISDLINKLAFPKAMKWGNKNLLFARPLRNIIALWDDEILPIEVYSINSSNIAFGNRFLAVDTKIKIDNALNYQDSLKKVKVIANRDERKSIIKNQIKDIYNNADKEIIEDAKLLETVCDLVEYPTCIVGEFDKKYLELPEKIITSTLSQHQKYFSVKNKNGTLANEFLFVSNGNPGYSEIIKKGNEKVIIARLDDAAFFWNEDCKNKLESYVQKLSDVTFEHSLGSVLDKTNRVIKLAKYICDKINLDEQTTTDVLKVAKLAKADLVTLMLGEKEFTKLQGYMGMMYAKKSGENENVALGIYEHYQPRGQNDFLPSQIYGSIVAIADKLDTVCGICAVDKLPSGSQDPFALRRAANGVVQIILDKNLNIDLKDIINYAFKLLNEQLNNNAKNIDFVKEFFKQRVKWLLQQQKFNYDVIDSVMHIDYSNIADLANRASAVSKLRQDENFLKLVSGFKRVSNIIANKNISQAVNQELLIEETEKNFYNNFKLLKLKIEPLIEEKKYDSILFELVKFSSDIDTFFDEILVNCEDINVKNNRIRLLAEVRKEFLKIADIAQIVIDG